MSLTVFVRGMEDFSQDPTNPARPARPHQTTHYHHHFQSLKNIYPHKSNNLTPFFFPPRTTLARERFEFQKKKAKPAEPSWKEHLASMRQQAIDLGFVPPEPPNPMKR
jgi:hypothetical protein